MTHNVRGDAVRTQYNALLIVNLKSKEGSKLANSSAEIPQISEVDKCYREKGEWGSAIKV